MRNQNEGRVSRRLVLKTGAGAVAIAAGSSLGLVGGLAFAQDAQKGGTLDVALWQGLQTLDWQSTTAHPVPHAVQSVWEGLYALGEGEVPRPELAESHEVSEDGTVWTFHLRQGVLFHSGAEMISADVVASLERWRVVSPRSSQLANLTTIEAVDPHTVRLTFSAPIGEFLLFVLAFDAAKVVVMPEAVAKASPDAGQLTEVVGTGPYVFSEYSPDNFLRLTRFNDYASRTDPANFQTGEKIAHVDEIMFWIVPESTTRVAGLETGEFDVIERLPDIEFSRLSGTEGVEPLLTNPPVMSVLYFNHAAGSMFADLNMRRAVQAAIYADEVAASIVADTAITSTFASLMPVGNAYYSDAAAELYNQNNPDKAREHLAAAGYNNEPIRFMLLSSEDTIARAVVAAGAQLQRAGMNVVIESYDLGTWVAKRRDATAYELFASEGVQPDPLLWGTTLGGQWPGADVAFKDAEISALLENLASEASFEARQALAAEMQRLVYDKVAFVPMGWHHRLRAKRTTVQDPANVLTQGQTLSLNNLSISS
jgi:peptide/nickel transport system substrate-binding protein